MPYVRKAEYEEMVRKVEAHDLLDECQQIGEDFHSGIQAIGEAQGFHGEVAVTKGESTFGGSKKAYGAAAREGGRHVYNFFRGE